MIYGNSMIHWLDTNLNQQEIISMKSLFGKYSMNIKNIDDNKQIIEFPRNDNVYVSDWKGWTNIRYIYKEIGNFTNWISLTTKHNRSSLTITSDNIIPIFDPDDVNVGFHGETIYGREFKKADSILTDDILRVIHCQNKKEIDIDFDKVKDIRYPKLHADCAYHICTKSKYFNCNDYYIYSHSFE